MLNKFGGDTGIDADFGIKNSEKKEIIYIDGYWLDTKEKFCGYKCVIGEWDGNEDDDDIFYYFDTKEDLEGFKVENVKGRIDTEFVITKVKKG